LTLSFDHVQHTRPRRRRSCSCCLSWLLLLVGGLLAALALAWFFLLRPERSNVLVLGLDRRPGEGDVVRADAIMVVTADPGEPSLGLLSIPRDLYLPIPGQGENRINTAHFFGELDEPGSGPQRTADTVSRNFGVPLDGWVRLDFHGFVSIIDAMGGIELEAPERVLDYAYPTEDYGVMTIDIPAGWQEMDGERALQYARSRHSSSDFDRAARQQLVIRAIVSKLSQPGTWPRLPALYQAFSQTVDTDLSLLQLARVVVAVMRVGSEGMERLVIDQDMVAPFTTPAGAAVLAPRWEIIQPQVKALFDLP